MRIDVKGRNLPVSDELREHVAKRFRKVERQVSELASLEVELFEERNPAIPDSQIADANLYLKGVTLRARNASPDVVHSINLVSEEIGRQVKRHRDKRRKRRESRGAAAAALNDTPPTLEGEVVLEGDVVLQAEVEPMPPDISSAA
jgi:putative sigma-54 modulation protein